ncbi:uncharacterized protein TNCV_2420671 [Trichonephila clavipes]|uniref:Uncharacterized protein n=1 Tax=Trichonephila clavipes TaxID=2585209 RepID=A0A8X6R7Y8_TRICX|nr:uncharacterized protein TNCV_2420671 [Trichonephila clavipes]
MWCNHNEAPPYYVIHVRKKHLNVTFGQRWIGRGDQAFWPALSSDQLCMDFIFWDPMMCLVLVACVRESTLEFFTLLNGKGKKELIEWCMKTGLIASSNECLKCNDQHDVTWSAIKRFLRNRASHAECMFDHYLAE